MSYTAGPWKIATRYPKSVAVICVEHPTFDALDVITTREWPRSFEEHQGNANLVAAAPSMKEALQSLVNEATGFLAMADPTAHGQTNLRCLQRRIDEARDALDKAEGR